MRERIVEFVKKKKFILIVILVVYTLAALFILKGGKQSNKREVTNYYVQLGSFYTKDRGLEYIYPIQNLRIEMNIIYEEFIRMQERSTSIASIRSVSLMGRDPKLDEIVQTMMRKLRQQEELVDPVMRKAGGVWLSKSKLVERKFLEPSRVKNSVKLRLILLLLSLFVLIGGMFLFNQSRTIVDE